MVGKLKQYCGSGLAIACQVDSSRTLYGGGKHSFALWLPPGTPGLSESVRISKRQCEAPNTMHTAVVILLLLMDAANRFCSISGTANMHTVEVLRANQSWLHL